jgi:hypothetical protein
MPQTVFYARDGRIGGYFLGTRPRPVFEQAFRDLLAKPSVSNDITAGRSIAGHS